MAMDMTSQFSVDYTVYDNTGKILQTGNCPELYYQLQAGPNRNTLRGAYSSDTHWVDGSDKPVLRPANPCVLKGMDIVGIPAKAVIVIDQFHRYPCDDGIAELSFDYAGKHTVKVECFPYLDKTFEVTNG